MLTRNIIIICCLLFASINIYAQATDSICMANDTAKKMIPKAEHIRLKFDREKGCYPGDTIHFKVAITENAVSNVVYVDLVHPNGETIMSRKLKLDDEKKAQGTLVVDSLYGSGFYRIVAYTRYSCNWIESHLAKHIVPVYSLMEKAPKYQKEVARGVHYISTYIDFKGKMVDATSIQTYYFINKKRVEYTEDVFKGIYQPIENGLMVFGRIEPKGKAKKEISCAGKRFKVFVLKGKESFGGDVVTDSQGYFAIKMPDNLKGEWNLFMYENRTSKSGTYETKEMAPFRVTYHEMFEPKYDLSLNPEEIAPKNFGQTKWKDDKTQNEIYSQFINCDKYSLKKLNNGYVAQNIYHAIGELNRNFTFATGLCSPMRMNVSPDSVCNRFLDISFPNNHNSEDIRTVCYDGLGYSGRPVVWIVNGCYRMVTCMTKPIKHFKVLRPSTRHMPNYINEVRNIYITSDVSTMRRFVQCEEIEKRKPIVVVINTHDNYIWNDSGLLSSHFRGYDN